MHKKSIHIRISHKRKTAWEFEKKKKVSTLVHLMCLSMVLQGHAEYQGFPTTTDLGSSMRKKRLFNPDIQTSQQL